jgi:predicted small lipoprotein YifL
MLFQRFSTRSRPASRPGYAYPRFCLPGLVLLATLVLNGCGNPGALYLPEQPAAEAARSADPQSDVEVEAEDDEDDENEQRGEQGADSGDS